MQTFNCYDCEKLIETDADARSFFDNSVCQACETKMFQWMEEQGKKLKATSPDTIERFNKAKEQVKGMYCYKCLTTDGPIIEVESMDQVIKYCEAHYKEWIKTYNVKV